MEKILTTMVSAAALMSASHVQADNILVTPNGSQPSVKGPEQYFSGTARIDPLILHPQAPTRTSAAYVTFEPGARTAWHTHPLGQMLVVTAGKGWVQEQGSAKREIKPGDVVWIPPGVKHWHGASGTTALTHIAIQEALDGKSVDWLEKVSDQDYGK